ncbi:MAG TPA: hypothetical protein PK431_15255 [Chitinophagales bacterium]|nr:hypothetical protein [Chitinophagales bacterium]
MKTKYTANLGDFHFGNILKNYIDTKKISKAALARKIKRKDGNILHYQKSATLQISIVHELSHALKHNFFMDIAMQLPPTYTVTAPPDTSKDERIAQLEQENAILKAEKQVLIEVAKG